MNKISGFNGANKTVKPPDPHLKRYKLVSNATTSAAKISGETSPLFTPKQKDDLFLDKAGASFWGTFDPNSGDVISRVHNKSIQDYIDEGNTITDNIYLEVSLELNSYEWKDQTIEITLASDTFHKGKVSRIFKFELKKDNSTSSDTWSEAKCQ